MKKLALLTNLLSYSRRTNREIPSKCLPYVDTLLAPITDLNRQVASEAAGHDSNRLLHAVVEAVAIQYGEDADVREAPEIDDGRVKH